jgi:hypothetical protein
MMKLLSVLSFGQVLIQSCSAASAPGASSYVVPAGFPTSAFTSYYFLPATPTQEPQPAIFDPLLGKTYPANLTNPDTIPTVDDDPVYYPTPSSSIAAAAQPTFLSQVVASVSAIINNSSYTSNCTKCIDALVAGAPAAQSVPSLVPNALVSLCQQFKFASNSSCVASYAATNYGATWTQVLAFANLKAGDGQYICYTLGFCPRPYTA